MSRPGTSSHEQRLSKGRRVRQLIASDRRALRSGDIRIGDVLRDPPDALGKLPIYVVLKETPKIGEKTSQKLCQQAHIWPLVPLEDLPLEKRAELINALPERVRHI